MAETGSIEGDLVHATPWLDAERAANSPPMSLLLDTHILVWAA
jgi:hypothetical protein